MHVAIHTAIYVKQFLFHEREPGDDRIQQFLSCYPVLEIKFHRLSSGNIPQGCKKIHFHWSPPLPNVGSRNTSTFILPLEIGEKKLTTASPRSGVSIPSLSRRGLRPST